MELPGFLTVLAWVPIGMICLDILIGLLRFNRLGRAQKLLTFLLVVALLAECVSFFLSRTKNNTYAVFHFYAIVEYALLAMIFIWGLNHRFLGRILVSSIFVILIYGAVNAVLWQPLSTPNTNVTSVSAIIMICLSVLFFFRALHQMRYPRIENSALFWISIGVLIYFASSLIMFVYLSGIAPADFDDVESVLMMNIIFNIIHYLCFNIALWMDPE